MKIIRTTFLLMLSISVVAQSSYNAEFDYLGFHPTNDSLEHYSSQIAKGIPVTAGSKFKVFSIVEYGLNQWLQATDQESNRIRLLDSLTASNPYYLIFYWVGNQEAPFERCEVYFSYPKDRDFNNCFFPGTITLLQAQVQRITNEFYNNNIYSVERYDRELEALRLLSRQIDQVSNCCAAQDAKSGCSLCPSSDEIDLIQNQLRLRLQPTIISLDENTNYSEVVDAAIQPFAVMNYIGKDLTFGQTVINLERELALYNQGRSELERYSVVLLNDHAYCVAELNGDRSNVTIFNIKSSEIGYKILVSEKQQRKDQSFFYFIVEKYPEVFGFAVVRIDEVDPLGLPDADIIQSNDRCWYTPTGALLRSRSNYTNRLQINDVQLAINNPDLPTGTLSRFVIQSKEYHVYRWQNYIQGYFNTAQVDSVIESGAKVTSVNFGSDGFQEFTATYPEALLPVSEICIVKSVELSDCESGRRFCEWTVTSEHVNIKGSLNDIVMPPDAECGNWSIPTNYVCCSLGQRYIKEEFNKIGTVDNEEKNAIIKIGNILCDVGSRFFPEYEEGQWGQMQDPLEILYQAKVTRANMNEDCSPCSYTDLITVFENYRDKVFSNLDRLEGAGEDNWYLMYYLLNNIDPEDFKFISAQNKLKAFKALGEHLDDRRSRFDPYHQNDEYNSENREDALLNLFRFNGLDHCDFVGMALEDTELLSTVFYGFRDQDFFGDSELKDYEELINSIFASVNICSELGPKIETSNSVPLHLGFELDTFSDGDITICEIQVNSDECFRQLTISQPSLTHFVTNSGNVIRRCTYNALSSQTVTMNGPLDYFLVRVDRGGYANILEQGTYLIPGFLLCFIGDRQDLIFTQNLFQTMLATGIIVLTAVTIPGASLAYQILGAVEIVQTAASTSIHNSIRNDHWRQQFPHDSIYQEWVTTFTEFENIYTTFAFTQLSVELAPAIVRKASKLLKQRPGTLLADNPMLLRMEKLMSGLRIIKYADLPNLRKLFNYGDLGHAAAFFTKIDELEFTDDAFRILNKDLESANFQRLILDQPELLDAWLVMAKLNNDASMALRLESDMLLRLTDDLDGTPELRSFIQNNGNSGFLAWKYSDNAYPAQRTWCIN